ncbi:follistatin-related protein 5-like [Dendronephthya gigantea]|uniref:follistatin-related protein 5-like n=1 Tax=Dendronephthya gigantea TaxID=151771 RepID=UPI0010695BC3|nr:follistatin-related protein 5-like [Dendronephthya gigantea]
MMLRVFLPILVILGNFASAKENSVFYVLGGDGIYVIDPVAKRLVAKITNTTAPGLCTKSNNRVSRNDCWLSEACVVDDAVFVADASGNSVHVIDSKTRKKIETIPTDPFPIGLHCLLWRKEVWVHSWSLSTFDIIATESRNRTHKAVRAHIKPGWTHGYMVADKDLNEGKTAFVTHFKNPGIHELNLETKTYTSFRNFSKYGCTGTMGIAYNAYNKYLFVECQKGYRSLALVTQDTSGGITISWSILGVPFVSPNGRYVVILHRNTSIMNIFAIEGSAGININVYPRLSIPGGVSHAVFFPKGNTSDSYNVFVTLDYSNKIAVIDLSLGKKLNISDVKYIENVGFLDSTTHGASRNLFINNKWIISPATRDKAVVIINAETRKIHGKISGVNEGTFAVWVPGRPPATTPPATTPSATTPPATAPGTSGKVRPSCLIFLVFLYVFVQS